MDATRGDERSSGVEGVGEKRDEGVRGLRKGVESDEIPSRQVSSLSEC